MPGDSLFNHRSGHSLLGIRGFADRSLRQIYHAARRRYLRQHRLQEFDCEHPCIFVLSTGRVGTQTLSALFGLSSNLFAYHEPSPKLFALSKLAYQYAGEGAVSAVLREAFLVARWQHLSYSLECRRGYAETSPQVTFLAPAILGAVPNAKFVHLVRDPKAVVSSATRRRWYNGHPADETRILPRTGSAYSWEWNSYDAFQKNLWLWAETNRWILKFCSTLPSERTLLVRAEDIFAAKTQALQHLYGFLNATVPSSQRIAGVLSKKLNAQESGFFREPNHWAAAMRESVAELVERIARELGYEISWLPAFHDDLRIGY